MLGNILWVVGFACAIWVIYDVLSFQKKMKTLHKVLWITGAIVFSIITALVYYLVVKKK